jgi:hypothetical protein
VGRKDANGNGRSAAAFQNIETKPRVMR